MKNQNGGKLTEDQWNQIELLAKLRGLSVHEMAAEGLLVLLESWAQELKEAA